MTQHASYPVHEKHPELFYVLSITGLLGCAALIIGTLVAPLFVPDYNWISDTISDLAAGEYEIIMDVSLYGFGVGIMATALIAAHDHLGRAGWSAGVISLAIIAGLVIIIGARNEYGDGDTGGVVIHIYLVYALGVFFTLVPLTMFNGLRHADAALAWGLIGCGIVWVVIAPIFLSMGTQFDGLIERILGLAACGMIVILDIVFLRKGRKLRQDQLIAGGR